MHFNINFNTFFKLIKVHLLVRKLYIYQNARYNNKKFIPSGLQHVYVLYEHAIYFLIRLLFHSWLLVLKTLKFEYSKGTTLSLNKQRQRLLQLSQHLETTSLVTDLQMELLAFMRNYKDFGE